MANGYQSKRTGADVDRLLDKIDEFNPATKVDKVSGKQLSTEDFTTALKQKLQGLENYDDTEINNAIAGLRRDFDTLISGDTSEAIDTFNDIVAFLEGIEESENLDNIIAAIQTQIAGKQDKINDLGTIRAGAAKGATALQQHQDISHLATKDEVTQGLGKKVSENQVGELNLALVDGLDNSSLAYALPDSANGDEDDILLSRNSVKTINSQSIFGSGNITIKEYNDTTLVNRVAAVEASVSSKANTNGVYPEMSVGLAEDLGGRPFFEDAEFVFRASAGEDYSIKDGLASIQSIKGNSVVWNNMVDTRGYEGGFVIRENIKIIKGHKYLLQREQANSGLYLIPVVDGQEKYDIAIRHGKYSGIFESQHTDTTDARVFAEEKCGACIISDLTLMFGAGNEPTTIEEFYARIPSGVDLNAYNAGEVIHMNTESIKSVGENAWDEQWEEGIIDGGNNYYLAGWIRSKNYIKIIAGEEYYYHNSRGNTSDYMVVVYYDKDKAYLGQFHVVVDRSFTMPVNAHYIRFYINDSYGGIYTNDIMLTLVHSGWKQDMDAGYQPYWEDRLDLSVIGKYFPQGMKKAGSAYDEIRFNKASGKWEAVQRIGEVDMGTINWREGYGDLFSNQLGYFAILDDASFNENNILTSKYTIIPVGSTTKGIHKFTEKSFVVVDSAYTDAASFKAAMSGVMLYYELAEPIVTEIAEDIELIYDVADFGTEEAIASVPSTPFRARIMYDFNANDSIRNNSVTIRELKRIIAELTNRINSLESNQQ